LTSGIIESDASIRPEEMIVGDKKMLSKFREGQYIFHFEGEVITGNLERKEKEDA
jgi:hypothetical protein